MIQTLTLAEQSALLSGWVSSQLQAKVKDTNLIEVYLHIKITANPCIHSTHSRVARSDPNPNPQQQAKVHDTVQPCMRSAYTHKQHMHMHTRTAQHNLIPTLTLAAKVQGVDFDQG